MMLRERLNERLRPNNNGCATGSTVSVRGIHLNGWSTPADLAVFAAPPPRAAQARRVEPSSE